MNTDAVVTVVRQSLRSHDDPEIRSSDADVNDIGDRRAGIALELARVQSICELEHPLTLALHERHDVVSVEHERTVCGAPERDVKRGAILSTVDVLTREHGFDPGSYFCLICELEQARERLLVEPLTAVIEPEAVKARAERFAAMRILSEQFVNVRSRKPRSMAFEDLPGRRVRSVGRFRHALILERLPARRTEIRPIVGRSYSSTP